MIWIQGLGVRFRELGSGFRVSGFGYLILMIDLGALDGARERGVVPPQGFRDPDVGNVTSGINLGAFHSAREGGVALPQDRR